MTQDRVQVDLDLNGQLGYADRPRDVPDLEPTIDLEGRRDTQAILRQCRRLRFPELFELKFSREFVDTHRVREPSIQAVAKDLREGLDPADKFVVIFHPAFQRHALMELVRNPQDGGSVYYTTLVAQEPCIEGELPADLNREDRMFEHLRGQVGDFRPINKEDVDVVRYYADKRLPQEVSCKRLNELQDSIVEESDRVHEDMMEDFHDYYFLAINTAANDGRKQYCLQNQAEVDRLVADKPSTKNIYQRDGYRIRVRKGTALDLEMAELQRKTSEESVERQKTQAWLEHQNDLRRRRLAHGLTQRTM